MPGIGKIKSVKGCENMFGNVFTAPKPPAPKKKCVDAVNHPSHYNAGKIECIEALESATAGLCGIEAICWYIDKLIEKQKEMS